jgi:hypothetical protein
LFGNQSRGSEEAESLKENIKFLYLTLSKNQKWEISSEEAKALTRKFNLFLSKSSKRHEYEWTLDYEKTLKEALEGKKAETKPDLGGTELEPSESNKALPEGDPPDPAETWSSRWVASPVAYLFPKERREEWLGDLREVSYIMLHQESYPRWMVNIVVAGRTVVLLASALKIQLSDLLALKRRAE